MYTWHDMNTPAVQTSALPIVFAADGNFSVPLAMAVESLLQSARPETRYDIHVLDDGVLDFAKRHIESLHGVHMFTVTYHPVAEMVQGVATTHYFPRVSFARFMIPEMLAEQCGPRIFYSDADVLFTDDLSDLFRMDMQGKSLAGIQELAVLAEGNRKHLQEWASQFGFSPQEALYCNSGNLLFDCKAWVQRGHARRIMELAHAQAGASARFPDQDIMNAVCQGDMALVLPRYCAIPLYGEHYASEDPDLHFQHACRYSREELQQAAVNPALIHFAGQKPRVLEGARYPLEQRFIDFWAKSAWRDYMPYSPRIGSMSPSRFIKLNVPISSQLGVLRKELLKYTVASCLPLPKRRHYAGQRDAIRGVLGRVGK